MSKLTAITFLNCRQQQLVGVLHHGIGEETSRPCLIACHGFVGTKFGGSRRFLVDFARYAVEHNFSVFRFDFAGCGDSEGEFVDLTLNTELEDLQAAVDAVSEMEGIDPTKIGIFGQCLGAVTAIRAGYRDERIYKVVAWAPFVDFNSALLGLVGEDAFAELEAGRESEFIYHEQSFSCNPKILEEASKIDMFEEMDRFLDPLLVIHGTEDSVVPVYQVEKLMRDTKKTAGEKRLAIIEGAHHSFPYHQDELFDLTIKWFESS
jgi:uncharacterized protein